MITSIFSHDYNKWQVHYTDSTKPAWLCNQRPILAFHFGKHQTKERPKYMIYRPAYTGEVKHLILNMHLSIEAVPALPCKTQPRTWVPSQQQFQFQKTHKILMKRRKKTQTLFRRLHHDLWCRSTSRRNSWSLRVLSCQNLPPPGLCWAPPWEVLLRTYRIKILELESKEWVHNVLWGSLFSITSS